MPIVDGKFKALTDAEIGGAPQAQAEPTQVIERGRTPELFDRSTIAGDIQAQYREEGHWWNPFDTVRTVGNIYSTIVKHAVTPPSDTPKSIWQKSGEDVASLGAILPTIISHPVKTVMEMPSGLVESLKNIFNPQYYKDHPVLGVVNTATTVTGIAGLLKGSVMKGVISSGEKIAATEVAARLGLDAAESSSILSRSTLRASVREAYQTGNIGIVRESVKSNLVNQGIEASAAAEIATKVATTIELGLKENGVRLNVLNKLEHPIQATREYAVGRKVVDEGIVQDLMSKGVTEAVARDLATSRVGGISKLTQSVFAAPEKTAVGRIYGTEAVAKNPAGFLDMENWAGQQAVERGLRNTVDNRQLIMNDWAAAQGDWALLSPEERVARHQNYIKATEMTQRVNAMTGDINVPTKFLPPSHVEAISENIKNAAKKETVREIYRDIKREYGNDIALHDKTISAVIEANPTREALIEVIKSLGKRSGLTYRKLPEVNALIKEIETTTGYRVIEAPRGKKISFATTSEGAVKMKTEGGAPSVPAKVAANVGESIELIAAKTRLSRLMERIGMSPHGEVGGGLEAAYIDEFTQNANKTLGAKYGETIKIGSKVIPLDKLYNWLDIHKNDISQTGSGVFSDIHYSVSDISVRNLTRLGVDQAIAKDIVAVAKQSLRDIPVSKIGASEAMVNYLRSRMPGYNAFYKLKNEMHFNVNPFFAARKQFKNNVLANLNLGKLKIELGETMANAVTSTIQRIPYLNKVPYLQEIFAPNVGLSEIKMMADEVLFDINKNIIDYASNPELAALQKDFTGVSGINKTTGFARSIQDRNVFSRYIGYNVNRHATSYAKSLAEKYGMGLEDALSFRVENGVKVYNNPEMVNMIKETTQAIFHYKPGYLTSPLARTINTIWFPTRFETKVVMQTAKWFGNISPMSRVAIVDSWVHFVNFKESDEGKKWLKENHSKFETTLDYLLSYKDIAESIESFSQGRIFDGNTGMLGGLPFGFVVNILQDLAIIPESERENPVTGKVVKKETPKKLFSRASVVTTVEDLLTFMLPSDPAYTLFGGTITPFGRFVQENVRGITAWSTSGGTDTPKKELKKLNKQFKTVEPDYTRLGD